MMQEQITHLKNISHIYITSFKKNLIISYVAFVFDFTEAFREVAT